jgi:hypothetical protein
LRNEIAMLAEDALVWSKEAGHEEERSDSIAGVLHLMGEFRAFELDADLVEWEPGELREFLLEWVPETILVEEDEADGFIDAVCDAFLFLSDAGLLDGTRSRGLRRTAKGLRVQFARAIVGETSTGFAEVIAEAMVADGVDLDDEAAVGTWIEGFNALSIEERDAILGPLDPMASPVVRPSASGGRRGGSARKTQKQARKKNRRRR